MSRLTLLVPIGNGSLTLIKIVRQKRLLGVGFNDARRKRPPRVTGSNFAVEVVDNGFFRRYGFTLGGSAWKGSKKENIFTFFMNQAMLFVTNNFPFSGSLIVSLPIWVGLSLS